MVALLFLLREARDLLAPVVIAIVLTFVLAPLVRALRRVGVPAVLGSAIVVAALLGTVVPLAASLAEPAAVWWERAPAMLTRFFSQFDRMRASVPGLAPPPVSPQAARAPRSAVSAPTTPPPDPVKERIASEGVALTGALVKRGASFAITVTATLILLYFLLASEHWMLTRWVEAVPRRRSRALVLGGVRTAQREIGRFVFALGLINIGTGAATGLVLWWLGLPNPTLWAVLVAILNFVPYIGPLIIIALLGMAGVFSFDATTAMAAPALAFLGIHAIESNVISPWVVGRRLSLSPISVFLSVMFWGWLWGIAGALIAVPLLIGLRVVCRRTPSLRAFGRFLDGDARPMPTLRSLVGARRRRVGPLAPPAQESVSLPIGGAEVRRVEVLPEHAGEPVAGARPLQDHA